MASVQCSCSNSVIPDEDARPSGAVDGGELSSPDAQPDSMDAGPPMARPFTPNAELSPTAGRVTGGQYSFDFQLGHVFEQRPVSNNDVSLEGASAIKE